MNLIKKISVFGTLALLLLNACQDESNPVDSSTESQNQDASNDDSTQWNDSAFNFQDLQNLESQMQTLNTLFDPESFIVDSNSEFSIDDINSEIIQSQLNAQDINIPDSLIEELITDSAFVEILSNAASTQEVDSTEIQNFVIENFDLFINLIQYLPQDSTNATE